MMRRILLTEGTEFTGRSGATLKIETLPTQGYGGRLNGQIVVVRTFPPERAARSRTGTWTSTRPTRSSTASPTRGSTGSTGA